MLREEETEWEDQEEDPSPQPAIIFDIVTHATWVLLIILLVWIHLPWFYFLPSVALVLLCGSVFALWASCKKVEKEEQVRQLEVYGNLRLGVAWLMLIAGGSAFIFCGYLMFADWKNFRDEKVQSQEKTYVLLGIAGGTVAFFQGGIMMAFQKGFEEGLHFMRVQLAHGTDLARTFMQSQTRSVAPDENQSNHANNSSESHD